MIYIIPQMQNLLFYFCLWGGKMFKRSLLLSFAFTFLISFPITFAAPWYQENFDEIENGDLIGKGGWTGFHGFLVVQEKVFHGDVGKSIKTVPDGEADLKLPSKHDGVQYISFYIRKKGLNPFVAFYAGDSPDGRWNPQGIAAQINFGNGGVVETSNGGTMKDIGVKYVNEKWHHVRIVIDFLNKSYKIFFDDKLVSEGLAFKGTPKWLNWIRIQAGETHPLAFFDDFEIGDFSLEKIVMPKNKVITTLSKVKLSR
jgi:hypothetical protein